MALSYSRFSITMLWYIASKQLQANKCQKRPSHIMQMPTLSRHNKCQTRKLRTLASASTSLYLYRYKQPIYPSQLYNHIAHSLRSSHKRIIPRTRPRSHLPLLRKRLLPIRIVLNNQRTNSISTKSLPSLNR